VGTSRAWRMILAHHSLDRHAQQQVTDEHDGCADCWQDTAVAAVDAAGPRWTPAVSSQARP